MRRLLTLVARPPGPEMILQYKASALNPALTGVNTWPNTGLGGSTYDAYAASNVAPAYVANTAPAGAPSTACVRFTGGDYLETAAPLPATFGGNRPRTLFAVVRFPNGYANRNICGYGSVERYKMNDLMRFGSQFIQHFLGFETYSPSASPAGLCILAFVVDAAQSTTYVNDVGGISDSRSTGIDTTLTPFRVGAGMLDVYNTLVGLDIVEIRLFNGSMTRQRIRDNFTELKNTYGVPS
jgi:hypothetical protein